MLWEKVWRKVNQPEVVTHLAMRFLYWGGGELGALEGGRLVAGGTLTTGQPIQSSTKPGHEKSLQEGGGLEDGGVMGVWGGVFGVNIWPKVILPKVVQNHKVPYLCTLISISVQ